MRNRTLAIAMSFVVALGLAAWWLGWFPSRVAAPASAPEAGPVTLRDSTGPVTLALTGDTMAPRGFPQPGADPAFDAVVRILQHASLGITNLDGQLRRGASDPAPAAPGWNAGTPQMAGELRRIGFTLISRANNHGADGGADAIAATSAAIDAAGLFSAGAGGDLDAAQAPAVVGVTPRRVALISVTTSAADEARATKTRGAGEIIGRPGVNVLRYSPDVVADPATYAALREMAIASHQIDAGSAELRLSGRLIRKGDRTTVDLVADENDEEDILATIAKARAAADVVVVSLHSHEPGNRDDEPAAFVERFAKQAIDRGASLVVGHGPHRLRGIEIYKGGAIFYSLGNFAFEYSALDRTAGMPGMIDVYDADTNLAQRAITAPAGPSAPAPMDYSELVWWESVVATVTFDGGTLKSVRLDPIDLGVTRALNDRGTPRTVDAGKGTAILHRLQDLSTRLSTPVRIQDGVGFVDVTSRPFQGRE
jgi:poly-gamma-glutamate capsule biosynthesis protein CapA/YwtB (metallophosphatase superfamily)